MEEPMSVRAGSFVGYWLLPIVAVAILTAFVWWLAAPFAWLVPGFYIAFLPTIWKNRPRPGDRGPQL